MNNSIRIQLVLLAIVGLLILSTIIFLLTGFLAQSSPRSDSGISPTPGSSRLTVQEAEYPQATPQEFQNTDTNKTGTLIVSTTTKGVLIKIDPPAIGETQGVADINTLPKTPDQYPPFRYEGLPAGEHALLASKPGYLAQKIPFAIVPSTITRLQITLIPLTQP